MENSLTLTISQQFYEIILDNPVLDLLNEYNATTGKYIPVTNGVYEISCQFDINGYTDTEYDTDILIGLWNFTDNAWVVRRTYNHRSSNIYTGRNYGYSFINFVVLDTAKEYGFRIQAAYNASSNNSKATLSNINQGATGSSASTTFAISKVLK